MIEQLFGSKTRVKLLKLFFSNTNRAFYVRELTRKIDEQINSVRRELANLLSIGVISSETTNNRLYYEVNQDYEYYEPLLAMFNKGPSAVKGQPLPISDDQKSLSIAGNISLALLTGRFTRDESSGIDLLVVGDIATSKFNKYIADMESREGKGIRYSVMPLTEFDYRRQINDRFITTVLASKNQVLIDKKRILNKEK